MTEHPDAPFFERAIAEMKNGAGETRVGAVVVHDGVMVASGSKGNGTHAERAAIDQARERDVPLSKTVLYTTLEPCVDVKPGQVMKSCADLIIEAGIPEVVIGRYDPNPQVYRKGWRALRDAGVRLRDFPEAFRVQIDEENKIFMNHFDGGVGPCGGAKVNHKDHAIFHVRFSETDERSMDIGWTLCGIDAAYGYATGDVSVALARYAKAFEEIDDPSAYEFSHSVRINTGEIGIFKGPGGFVLVKPTAIQSGPRYGKEDYFVKFRFKVRAD